MWYLEAFDKESTFLVRDYPLRGVDTTELRTLVEIRDSYEIDGVAYPPEAGAYDVSPSALPEIVRYIDEPFSFDESCDYQIEFYYA